MVILSVMTRLEPDYRLSGQALCGVAFSIFDITVCLIAPRAGSGWFDSGLGVVRGTMNCVQPLTETYCHESGEVTQEAVRVPPHLFVPAALINTLDDSNNDSVMLRAFVTTANMRVAASLSPLAHEQMFVVLCI